MRTRDELVELDRRHLWHPYTAMDAWIASGDPLVIDRAEGAWLVDRDGRRYLDGNASWWTAALGHGHPRLVGALVRQARELCHTSLAGVTHEPAAALAAELVAVAPPGLRRVFFSDNGSTAIDVAVKLAVQYWNQNGHPRRTRFVALDGAYHGDTVAATALGGVELFRRPFAGVLMDCLRVPRAGADSFEHAMSSLERLLASASDEIAAVVVEPLVQGAAGMRMYDPRWLREARRLCDRHDVLLIIDEVFAGFGRTGTFWASERAGVSPDLLCTAKGLTGGLMPMAATLATERLFEGFFGGGERTFFYGHTFCGNPLGAAIAREVLAVFRDEAVVAGITPRAARIREAFLALGDLPGVSDARALGMIGALELGGGGDYLDRSGWDVAAEARRRGALLRPLGSTVYICPPLNLPMTDLDELLGIVTESVRAVALGAARRDG